MQELDEIWYFALEELKKRFSEAFISVWLKEAKLISLTDTSAIIYIKDDIKRDIVEKKHAHNISEALENVLGYTAILHFTSESTEIYAQDKTDITQAFSQSEPSADQKLRDLTDEFKEEFREEFKNEFKEGFGDEPKKEGVSESMERSGEETAKTERQEKEEADQEENKTPFMSVPDSSHAAEYTFENFIVGSSNKFAYAACTSVAKNPAHSYNPLFIYGPSGLGKTHLLYAITNEIKKNHPTFNIIYVKGEEFTNQMIESIGSGHTAQFREKYRRADVLLIDDIHFIAGKDSTQEEFFHTFNDLYEHKKQIILTSDRPAKDIQKLEERLRTRFEWGLPADIQPPDFELRIAIMKKKAQGLGREFPNEVLTFLAEKLTNNIRQIEGAIRKIVAYSLLGGAQITIPLVQTCISDLLVNNGVAKVTPEKIISKVSSRLGVSADDVYSKKKSGPISKARHISIYLMRKISDLSYPSIGKILNRDHSTVMSSYRLIETEIKNNSAFEIEINDIIKDISHS